MRHPVMGFEERLRRIRGQAAGPDAVRPQPQLNGSSLAERLRRLSTGGLPRARAKPPDEAGLAESLGAVILAPGVLRLERRLPARLRHGRALLGPLPGPWDLPWPLSGPPVPEGRMSTAHRGPGWLCLDTETSGLAGGTGTWAFLTGLLRAGGDGWCLRQYVLTRLDAEPAYLDLIGAELNPADWLLTYNGRAFDAPLLATRFRLAGRPDPVRALPHLDLLGPMRRAFGRTWPDCRLVTAESRLLGFHRTDDLPGSAAPAAWLDWLRRGETAPLAAVLRHNRDDLLSLAGLLSMLAAVYRDPASSQADIRAVAGTHAARGNAGLALRILAASERGLDPAGLHDLARLCRRAGDWDRALGIWEGLAAQGDAPAREALARFHEHKSRDLRLALALTEALPPGAGRERRRERLKDKLRRGGGKLRLGSLGADG